MREISDPLEKATAQLIFERTYDKYKQANLITGNSTSKATPVTKSGGLREVRLLQASVVQAVLNA